MSIPDDQNLDNLLEKLRKGSAHERIEAATALGDTRDMQVIPPLRRALKRLKDLQPYPPDQSADNPDIAYDPDGALRMALLDAITKLLLGQEYDDGINDLDFRQITVQTVTLADRSQLRIIVEAPAGNEASLASTLYNERLIPLLKEIETIE